MRCDGMADDNVADHRMRLYEHGAADRDGF